MNFLGLLLQALDFSAKYEKLLLTDVTQKFTSAGKVPL